MNEELNVIDDDGVLYLWQRLKTIFAKQEDIISESDIKSWISAAKGEVEDDIPVSVSDLTNDSNFQTESQVNTAITTALEGITGIDFQIVTQLPNTGEKGVIYLLANAGTGNNIYDEYIYISERFEKIGTTEVDLSGYLKKTDITTMTNAEIDEILAS